MKTYEVEFKRTSYITITVKAESEDHADESAWQQLVEDGSYGDPDAADWETVTVKEVDDVHDE